MPIAAFLQAKAWVCLFTLLAIVSAQSDTYPSQYNPNEPSRYPESSSGYPGQGPNYSNYPQNYPEPTVYPGQTTYSGAPSFPGSIGYPGQSYPDSNRQYTPTTDPNGFEHFSVIYEWNKLDFTWPDNSRKAEALQSLSYDPKNNILSAAKVWQDRIFVTIPRWRRGVPATLASIPLRSPTHNGAPLLQPFPSWRMQEIGNCSALQFVQNFEIDTLGRMWIIDTGRLHFMDPRGSEIRCPPKLVILDLKGDYNNYNFNSYNQSDNQDRDRDYNQGRDRDHQNNDYNYNNQNRDMNNPNRDMNQNRDINNQNRDFNNQNRDYNNQNRDYNNPNQDYNNQNRDYNNQNRDYNNQNWDQNNRDPNNPQGREYNPGGYNQGRDLNDSPDYNRNNQRDYNNPDYNRQNEYGRPTNSFEARNPIGGYNQAIPSLTTEPTYNHEGSYVNPNQPQNPNRSRIPFRDMEYAKVLRVFNFPEAIASKEDSHLVDIVLDDTDGYFAYISDASDPDPGVIVYNYRDNKAHKVRDNPSMRAEPSLRSIYVNDQQVNVQYNLAGLALSSNNGSNFRTLYYAAFSSRKLFSIDTQTLRDTSLTNFNNQIKQVGERTSTVQAMTMSNRGILYYGLIENSTIARWDTHQEFYRNQRLITRDAKLLQWPSSFNIDERGDLYVVSNKYQNFIRGPIDTSQANFRIIRGHINQKSYLNPDEGPLDLGTFQTAASSPRDNWQSYDSRGAASAFTSSKILLVFVVFLASMVAARAG